MASSAGALAVGVRRRYMAPRMVASARPRIALITSRDASDPTVWSGTHHRIATALRRHVGDVTLLGPIPDAAARLRRVNRWARACGIGYSADHSLLVSHAYAAVFSHRLAAAAYDVVFAPVAATEIAYLRTSLPIVYLSDATFAAMLGYYPAFSQLSGLSRWEGNHIERRAIAKAATIIYASEWAADSARAVYGAPAEKLRVIPFGANLDEVPSRADALAEPAGDRCRLLFIGKDWERKGGAIAYEALRQLRAMGIDAELIVCGPRMGPPLDDPNVRHLRFLDPRVTADRQALADLYREATLFFLPTRAECAGIVFSEAGAFGLPVVSTDTGGVATVVGDGVTGRLLPPTAGGADYARVIRELLADPVALARMRTASRDAYESRLNWDAWGAAAGEVIGAAVRPRV